MRILSFAAGVTLKTPPTAAGSRILGTLERAARVCDFDVIVTSGTDSHTAPDPHALGEAFDVRTTGLTPDLVLKLYHWVAAELGDRFYVQFEVPTAYKLGVALDAIAVRSAAATGEHLHIQRAKGTVYP